MTTVFKLVISTICFVDVLQTLCLCLPSPPLGCELGRTGVCHLVFKVFSLKYPSVNWATTTRTKNESPYQGSCWPQERIPTSPEDEDATISPEDEDAKVHVSSPTKAPSTNPDQPQRLAPLPSSLTQLMGSGEG